jgi:hypothetical protein
MNSSSNRFNNPTQNSMKNTGLSTKKNEDYMGSNFGNMGNSAKEF